MNVGIKHTARNPFPFKTPQGKVVVDEMCACGDRRSNHRDTSAFGHGACGACTCTKYTWERFVFADEE